ncbi:EKA-like protein [Blumeria hordei DH14]|uniref:EKA-like protein n=1 Tax=Blumeria graminis f. sp. hordei (strain DH14) TaxID=546991 RepID=N1JNY0_BLUG1|nr:EKA-like protein [Blumeria hordei DH14]
MPPTRKTHQNTISGITKDRINKPSQWHTAIQNHAKNMLTRRGLESNLQNMNTIAAALQAKENDVPEVDMVDAEVEKLKTLWASSNQVDAGIVLKPAESNIKTVVAPEKRATVPALPRPVEVRPTKEADIPTTKAAGAENSSLDQPPTAQEAAGREKIFTPELLAAIEAEERRARQKAAQFHICSTAISSVETALSPLSTAIAQFVAAGPSTTPPVLPQRPIVATPPATAIPVAVPRNITKATAPLPLRSTWATITRAGHQKSGSQAPANITSVSAAPSARKPEKKSAASTTASKDDRIFLRLDANHEWRQLSPAGVREAVAKQTHCTPADVDQVQRVPTGFAIRAKSPDAKTRLLEASSTFTQVEAKLEPPSDLDSLRIATVPVAVFGLEGRVEVTAEIVAAEILRVTSCTLDRVRIHGKTKLGAPYRSWAALFPRNASPKPGFRLFDNSGIATIQRNRPPCYGLGPAGFWLGCV